MNDIYESLRAKMTDDDYEKERRLVVIVNSFVMPPTEKMEDNAFCKKMLKPLYIGRLETQHEIHTLGLAILSAKSNLGLILSQGRFAYWKSEKAIEVLDKFMSFYVNNIPQEIDMVAFKPSDAKCTLHQSSDLFKYSGTFINNILKFNGNAFLELKPSTPEFVQSVFAEQYLAGLRYFK